MTLTEKIKYYFEQTGNVFSYTYILPLLLAILIFVAIWDIKYHRLQDKFIIGIVVLRLVVCFYYPLTWNCILSGIGMFILWLVIAMVVMKKCGGDIKFVGSLGLWLGSPAIFISILFAILMALIWFLFQSKIKKNAEYSLPFAPFCCYGTILTYLIYRIMI